MNKALILGCSHAAGTEMYKDSSLNIPCGQHEIYGAQNSFPVIIAQSLNYQPLNHAIGGGSNDAIFRIFESELGNLSSNDIVIACWTGFDRGEVWYSAEQRWLQISHNLFNTHQIKPNTGLLQGINQGRHITDANFFQEYGKLWNIMEANIHRGRLNKIKNILSLNSLAQAHKIQVINIDSFNPIVDYPWPENIIWPLPNSSFCNWSDQQSFKCTDWGHYFRPAHQAYANLILENLHFLNQLTGKCI
jgi:hypothetical protein